MFFQLSFFHRTGELITLCIFLLFTLTLKKLFFSVVCAAGYTFCFVFVEERLVNFAF